jgi:hypothetical protein
LLSDDDIPLLQALNDRCERGDATSENNRVLRSVRKVHLALEHVVRWVTNSTVITVSRLYQLSPPIEAELK